MAEELSTIVVPAEQKAKQPKEAKKFKPKMSRFKKSLIALLGTAVAYVGADIGLSIYRNHRNEQTLQHLKLNLGLPCYAAGLPGYTRNFSRDAFISGLISKDLRIITSQLEISACKQGKRVDLSSGEEPGKIHHEFPSMVSEKGRTTEFAACDTTALFLLNHQLYQEITGDKDLAERQKENIDRALGYITKRVDERGMFIEDPKFLGAEGFGLRETYWKDGGFAPRSRGFPVVYSLAHIQNMAALRAASKITGNQEYAKIAEKMKIALQNLWDEETGAFYPIVDKSGPLRHVNSDSLHSLFYLEEGDLPRKKLERIVESSRVLETPYGYRLLPAEYKNCDDAIRIFPYENYIIYSGAKKHSLSRPQNVTIRIFPYLVDTDAEYFHLNDVNDSSKGYNLDKGDDPQLWTVAAKMAWERETGFFHRIRPEHYLTSVARRTYDNVTKEISLYSKFGFNPF